MANLSLNEVKRRAERGSRTCRNMLAGSRSYHSVLAHMERHGVMKWLKRGADDEEGNTIALALEQADEKKLLPLLARAFVEARR